MPNKKQPLTIKEIATSYETSREDNNPNGRTDKITIATGHKTIKGSTLLGSLGKANVTRDEFLSAYENV